MQGRLRCPTRRAHPSRLSKRYWLIGAALLAAACLPLLARRDGLAWELAQLAGHLSAIGCLFLTGAALRPRDARPSRLLTLDQHKWLAWISIALLGAHIGGALLSDRHTVEYLKPSMPAYQMAGLLAALALVIVSISALGRIRRVLWRSAARFRTVHILLAALLVILVFVQVVATDRYAAGPARWLWAAVTIVVLLLPFQRIPQSSPVSRWPFALGNHPRWLSLTLATAAFACLGLAAQKDERRAELMLEPLVQRAQWLPVDFPHEKHGTVNCIACHHNFVDRTGVDNCITCHRSERPDLRLGAEARFHTFCMDCHREGDLPMGEPAKRGPVSQCSACHRPWVPKS